MIGIILCNTIWSDLFS